LQNRTSTVVGECGGPDEGGGPGAGAEVIPSLLQAITSDRASRGASIEWRARSIIGIGIPLLGR